MCEKYVIILCYILKSKMQGGWTCCPRTYIYVQNRPELLALVRLELKAMLSPWQNPEAGGWGLGSIVSAGRRPAPPPQKWEQKKKGMVKYMPKRTSSAVSLWEKRSKKAFRNMAKCRKQEIL